MATCCVPWTEDDALDEPVFRASIRNLLAHDLRDLYIFGTAGEGYAVDEAQFDEITRVFQEEMAAAGAPPMVGLISLSLPTMIGRIERCLARGIDLFQISLPAWGALNDRELEVFFAETCGRFPAARFLHYNLRRAGRVLTPAEYGRLAEDYPNLVATKNAGADAETLVGLTREAGTLRHFLTEGGFTMGALLGEFGFLVSIASIQPALAHACFAAVVAGDRAAVADFGRDLTLLVAALKRAGSAGPYIDGAYDKVFCRLHDPAFSLRLLPPYVGWSEAEFAEFRRIVATEFPEWLPAGAA